MGETMTPRARWLAAVRMEPVDRLPFWPKIFDAYLAAHGGAGRETIDALHAYVGSDRHEGLDSCLTEVRTDTAVTARRNGDTLIQTFTSPRGEAVMAQRWDEGSCSWHPIKFPVETREDIRILTDVYRDCRWELDAARLEAAEARKAALGEDAVTTTGVGESPFMWWLEYLAGVENGHLLLFDYPDEVTELLDAMHGELCQRARLLAERHPVDLFYMMENTSTTLLSPAQYREYCQPYLREYMDILHAHDRLTVLHMCGLLKVLLPDIREVGARAFEAFTSPPVGNTTLADGRAACPDTCLIGGTNAVLWTQPSEEIIAELEAHLAALPHTRGVVVTSAGVMPPLATPETIKTVAEWVRGYTARN
ncbi:MAG: methylcobalamin:coenzyme M methyltransferase [bacterium ADurb.Bin429]|nr:MAG: methylcobalamin:coenzyme M methyltransferase [bacterium ADurb.Bin429]